MKKDDLFEFTWETRENQWLPYFKTTFYQLPPVILDIQRVLKK